MRSAKQHRRPACPADLIAHAVGIEKRGRDSGQGASCIDCEPHWAKLQGNANVPFPTVLQSLTYPTCNPFYVCVVGMS